jgi:hypothetical protein
MVAVRFLRRYPREKYFQPQHSDNVGNLSLYSRFNRRGRPDIYVYDSIATLSSGSARVPQPDLELQRADHPTLVHQPEGVHRDVPSGQKLCGRRSAAAAPAPGGCLDRAPLGRCLCTGGSGTRLVRSVLAGRGRSWGFGTAFFITIGIRGHGPFSSFPRARGSSCRSISCLASLASRSRPRSRRLVVSRRIFSPPGSRRRPPPPSNPARSSV